MFRYLDINSYFHKVGFAFRALRSRNFRLYFCGQIVSLMGTYMQNMALGWLVYRLSGSAFLLGAVGFAGQIPSLFLTPVAGVYADRANRRAVLVATQSLSMCMALLLAALYFGGAIEVWHIMAISCVNGLSLAFDTPFRHAFILEMVGDRGLLANAIALNSTLVNSARFIGPMVGGFLIALVGEGFCFLINGVSFVAVVISLLAMRVERRPAGAPHRSVVRELREGLRYAFDIKPIRHLLLLVCATGFIGMPFQNFLPLFAKDVLGGGSRMMGFLTGALGAGALLGALYLASRASVRALPRVIFATAALFGVGLAGFALSVWPVVSMALIFAAGFGMIVHLAGTNTLLQTVVDDRMRGRVVSLYSMSFMGITPLGSLLLGAVAPSAGAQATVAVAGGLCLLVALVYRRNVGLVERKVAEADLAAD